MAAPLSTAKLLRAVDVLEHRIAPEDVEPDWQADIFEYLTVIGQPRIAPKIDTLDDDLPTQASAKPESEPAKPVEEVKPDEPAESTK